MIKITRKKHGINLTECWFAREPLTESGIVHYIESAFKPAGEKTQEFRTLISDLTETEEEILKKFSKSCIYKVKRAPREGVTAKMYGSDELSDGQLIREFADFFEEFWKSKGVEYQENDRCVESLTEYMQAGALAIGTASVKDKVQVYHVYVMDEERARLLHSASQFRTKEDIPQTVVGFANRYLHRNPCFILKSWAGRFMTGEVPDWKKRWQASHVSRNPLAGMSVFTTMEKVYREYCPMQWHGHRI